MSTYVFSDLHAQYNLWQQIKNFIKPDDLVFCLGDCVDRGPAGLEILYEVMEMPNIILLRGNHEDFITKIGYQIIGYKPDDIDMYWTVPNLYLWEQNGAKNTIEAFQKLTEKEQWDLVKKIQNLPTHAEYQKANGDIIYLCHAGRQPDTREIEDMGGGDIPLNNYIWDRYHIMDTYWRGKDNEYCIHGHTPVMAIHHYLRNNLDFPKSDYEILKYCNGHKINIDLGSFITHAACLFDLNTFEVIYFKEEINEDTYCD